MKAKKELLNHQINYAVAISGGVDSFSAIHFLKMLKFNVCGIHFHHNLRPQNDLMQQACQSFCLDNNIPFITAKRTCNKGKLEHELRECRLNFFRSVKMPVICAHHLSDCAESYLMNAFKGQADHLPIKPISYFHQGPLTIIRPFLANKKKEMVRYAKQNDLIKYVVEDETNQHNNHLRNRVRNQILPLIKDRGIEKVVFKKFYSDF